MLRRCPRLPPRLHRRLRWRATYARAVVLWDAGAAARFRWECQAAEQRPIDRLNWLLAWERCRVGQSVGMLAVSAGGGRRAAALQHGGGSR
jgi:hypothetical protein